MSGIASSITRERDAKAAAAALAEGIGGVDHPKAIAYFCSHEHDGAAIGRQLKERFPGAEVIGCTTAGELTQERTTVGGVSAIALGAGKVKRAAGALARFEGDVESGVRAAAEKLAGSLELDLRAADPSRYVGIALVEGLKMKEEAANDALGNVAPQLSFVGGSAGDNLEFARTRVFYNGEESDDGAALLLLDAEAPFIVAKTCSFEPSGTSYKVTRADVASRTLYELDGRPVLEVYAEAVGGTPDKLDSAIFMERPFGLMIDGKPWIRSPQQVLEDKGLRFYCQILEGMEIHVMRSTDLVADTAAAMSRAREELGGRLEGGLTFNCILRRLELDAKDAHAPFLKTFEGLTTAGFHTYGESYLGHINQTLTALLFA